MSLASGTYNANARAQTLADALSQDANLVAKVWSKQLRDGAKQVDDFSAFEGGEKSKLPFVVRTDLQGVQAGDAVRFTVKSQPRGPGVRGEVQLTGATSVVNWAIYECKVDFWRDAFEYTQKQIKFMAAGGSIKNAILGDLDDKLGRKRMNDMKMALKLQGVGNILYPNGKKTLASLSALDTMSPSLLTTVKPQWQRLGGHPFMISKNKRGSPVYSCMCYIPDCAMTSIRLSSSYENALINAGNRGDENPMFSGKLLDWQGIGLFEHISVDAEYDVLADPLAPRATLGVAFSVDSAVGAMKLISPIAGNEDRLTRYFEFFGGYAYEWWEGQASDSAWSTFYSDIATGPYYAWIVNPDGSVGMVKWTSGNDGNQITLTGVLSPDGAGDSTLGATTLGDVDASADTWDSTPAAGGVGASNTSADFLYTDSFSIGAYIIPCNAKGAVEMNSLFMGAETAVRAYVGDDELITEQRDYKFVNGGGYQTIFGQAPCQRTDGKTSGYALLRHTGQHEGLTVPTLES